MFKFLNFLNKRKAVDKREKDCLDLFSENQCELDDARLVFRKFTSELGMPEIQGLVDHAWREVGRRLFADGESTAQYRIGN